MNFLSGLFRFVAIVVFMTSFVEVENVNTCETTEEITTKTMQIMKSCNSGIKDYYDTNTVLPMKAAYCEGMKILMKCAESETNAFEKRFGCTSKVLQDWVFVSFQYIVISKKIQLCGDHLPSIEQLKDKMVELGFQDNPKSIHKVSIPDDVTRQCAKAIHVVCAKLLMSKNLNLCQGVTAFVSKYVNSTDVANFPPAGIDNCKGAYATLHKNTVPEISKKFADIIKDFSLSLIQQYEEEDLETHSEVMCTVDDVD